MQSDSFGVLMRFFGRFNPILYTLRSLWSAEIGHVAFYRHIAPSGAKGSESILGQAQGLLLR